MALHLPLVISLKSTHNLVTHPRYDTPPNHHITLTLRNRKACERRRDGLSSSCEASTDWQLHCGYLESLAFRTFDKILIFGHWLSKTLKLALASGTFHFEKCFYYILVNYFQNSKIFSKTFFKMVLQKLALRYFLMCEAFLLS